MRGANGTGFYRRTKIPLKEWIRVNQFHFFDAYLVPKVSGPLHPANLEYWARLNAQIDTLRSFKEVRPVYHKLDDRIRSHVYLHPGLLPAVAHDPAAQTPLCF